MMSVFMCGANMTNANLRNAIATPK